MPNYPTSLDTLTNPTSSDGLASPPHATQHTDVNDIVEALEAKVGITASTPTSGKVLTGGVSAGTSTWETPAPGASAGLKQQAVSWGGVRLTGRYYDGQSNAASGLANSVDANVLYFAPHYVATAFSADRISINVTTAAGTLARLGIYTAGSTGRPDTLVLDAGTVATDSTGGKEITISQTLTADTLYWLAVVGNGGFGLTNRANTGSPSFGLTANTDTLHAARLKASFTFAALPANTSSLTLVSDDINTIPRITLRAA